MRRNRIGGTARSTRALGATLAALVGLPPAAAAQEPSSASPTAHDPEALGAVPSRVPWELQIATRIRVESPADGLELRLWAVTPQGPHERPFWSDEGRRLCRTPCTLALPEGSYTLGIDNGYQFDFVARGDPLLLHVTPRDQVLRKAGAWMLISGSIQFGAALVVDAALAFPYWLADGVGRAPNDEGPSFGEFLIGGPASAVFFSLSMVGLGVALIGAGLMLGGMGSVDEAPGNPEPESTGEVFVQRHGDRFFPETTGQE